MSEACSHNCSSCGSDCSERTAPQNSRNDNNKNVNFYLPFSLNDDINSITQKISNCK